MALFTYSARGLWLNISNELAKNILPTQPLGFNHDISGYAPDEFLTIETDDDDWTTEEGADGFVVRSHIPNNIAKLTLTLQQTSPTNDVLSKLWAISKGLDKVNAIGLDIFNFTVAHPAGSLPVGSLEQPIFQSQNCYISKIAQLGYGKESGTRAWEITAVDSIFGSDTITAMIQGVGTLARDLGSFTNMVK